MSQRLFYLEQASKCAAAASNCEHADERAKYLAAEKAWRRLAELPITISLTRAMSAITR